MANDCQRWPTCAVDRRGTPPAPEQLFNMLAMTRLAHKLYTMDVKV